jgi:hypothetical protein
VVGVSLGGWIAAEMAVKSCARLSHLVLANPDGIKPSDRETRDIADIFAMTDGQFAELAYFDPSLGKHDYKAMPEAEVRAVARSREATARYGWSPYMHDPKLKQRPHRIRVPTLVLWGTADRIVSKPYGRAYGAAILGARFEPIERAGHFPHLEQPEEFWSRSLGLSRPHRGRHRRNRSAQARSTGRRISAQWRHRLATLPQSSRLPFGRGECRHPEKRYFNCRRRPNAIELHTGKTLRTLHQQPD